MTNSDSSLDISSADVVVCTGLISGVYLEAVLERFVGLDVEGFFVLSIAPISLAKLLPETPVVFKVRNVRLVTICILNAVQHSEKTHGIPT